MCPRTRNHQLSLSRHHYPMVITIFYDSQCGFVSRCLTYLVLVLIVFVYTFPTILFPTVVPVEASEDAAKQDASNKIKNSVSGFRDSLTEGITELNPFKGPVHAPPVRAQDSFLDASWWPAWKWLHIPLSSSLTVDKDRALLPPLHVRPLIYCYYVATVK